MDMDVDNKPSCSTSLYGKPSNSVLVKNQNVQDDVILIDDSCDSDYETGSAISRSSVSSTTADLQEMNNFKTNNNCKIFYANVLYERNIISPWLICCLKDEKFKLTGKKNESIVISDSEDDDASTSKQSKKLNGVPYSTQTVSDVINLESDDEEIQQSIKYYTVEFQDGSEKRIPEYFLSDGVPPDSDKQLPPKTRVIARRKQKYFPQRIYYDDSKCEQVSPLYKNDDTAFYAGIISYKRIVIKNRYHYLVFFDDGHVQYVASKNIRVVFGDYGLKYVHENAQTFYDYYFNGRNECCLPEVEIAIGKNLRVFLNNKCEMAQVNEFNHNKRGLFQLYFTKSNISEWLYMGSPRIRIIWEKIVKEKQLKRYHEANTTFVEVSSDSEEEDDDFQTPPKKPLPNDAEELNQTVVRLRPELLIDNYKPRRKFDRHHTCGRKCVRDYETNRQIYDFDPLKQPLVAGWERKAIGSCYYITPCGRSFNTIETVYSYLKITKSKLSIDCFTFSSDIDCMTEVHSTSRTGQEHFLNDFIIGGWKEKQRIPVVPIADNLPYFKEYAIKNYRNPRSKKVPSILNAEINPFRSCCDCIDDCSDISKCSCWQLTLDGQRRQAGYKFKKLYCRVDTGIYECNPGCKCSTRRCSNRVVTAQIRQKLELYETKDRGYGIRCRTDIPKGTFVACYFGDLLHGKTADERAMKKIGSIHGDEYFMQLDHIEVAEKYKDGYESDVSLPHFSDDDDIDGDDDDNDDDDGEVPAKRNRLNDSIKSLTQSNNNNTENTNNYISYFPMIMKKRAHIEVNQRTTLFGENAVEFVVDGRYRGNISRFFNHSCQPNLFSQTVFVDSHDLRFPWLAFFASEDIKAGTELTWDYNYQIGSIEGREILCKCGTPNCRKRLL